jgi:hypothetical protein
MVDHSSSSMAWGKLQEVVLVLFWLWIGDWGGGKVHTIPLDRYKYLPLYVERERLGGFFVFVRHQPTFCCTKKGMVFNNKIYLL